MKIISILILSLFIANSMSAQGYPSDPGSSGIEVLRDTIAIGDTTAAKVVIANFGTDATAVCDSGDVVIAISLPVINGSTYELFPTSWITSTGTEPVSSSWNGDYFTWTYDNTSNVIVGINHTDIPYLGYEIFRFIIEGGVLTAYKKQILVNVQTIVGNNNTANDNLYTSVMVIPGVAFGLEHFELSANAVGCQSIINIKTDDKSSTRSLEVQESRNATDFETIQKVDLNEDGGYRYVYDRDPGIYFYRLQETDLDGEVTYSKPLAINIQCNNTGVRLIENPVKNNQLHLSGIQEGDVISVIDELGRHIYNEEISGNLSRVDFPGVAGSMYILTVQRDNHNIYSSKFYTE